MSKKRSALMCLSSLLLGCLLYILFRPNSYIGELFGRFGVVQAARRLTETLNCGFFRYYFPDYLWAFSLCFGLCAVQNMLSVMQCALIAVLCGVLWEVGQCAGFWSGTGDAADIAMYVLAGCTVTIIQLRRKT